MLRLSLPVIILPLPRSSLVSLLSTSSFLLLAHPLLSALLLLSPSLQALSVSAHEPVAGCAATKIGAEMCQYRQCVSKPLAIRNGLNLQGIVNNVSATIACRLCHTKTRPVFEYLLLPFRVVPAYALSLAISQSLGPEISLYCLPAPCN